MKVLGDDLGPFTLCFLFITAGPLCGLAQALRMLLGLAPELFPLLVYSHSFLSVSSITYPPLLLPTPSVLLLSPQSVLVPGETAGPLGLGGGRAIE